MPKTLRFLLCAIPGLLLFLAGLVMFGLALDSNHHVAYGPASAAAIAIGIPLILYGTGRSGKWGYILPFLALIAVPFAFSESKWSLLFLAVPFAVGAGVHAYYRRKV